MSAHAENLPDFDSLWNYDDPAGTESKFRELLPQAQASGNSAYHAELLSQIARTLGLQQKFSEAHTLLDSIEPMVSENTPRPMVRYLLERGRVFNSSKQPDSAKPLFVQAWELAKASKVENFAVDAAHMIAIATSEAADKMAWNLTAIAYAEQASDPGARRWLGSLYNNTGWTYFEQKQYDSAQALFEKALTFRTEQGKPGPIRIAKWCVARGYRALGRFEDALAMQQALEKEYRESGEDQDGYVFEELGECLLELKRPAEARPWFAKAYEYLSKDQWLARDEPARLERLKSLGETLK